MIRPRGFKPGLLSREWYPPCKCAGDVVIGVVLFLLTAPLIATLMILVRLTSDGPAIYSQTRLGLRGRAFRIYKLRTMYDDCERLTGPRWSTPGDPRVTPLGRWLRASHLDELPQLWNVIRGEMSLIGPRPERPEIARELEQVIPDYAARLQVRPGVTGLAQVQLPPDEDLTGVRRKVAVDAAYKTLMGPWLDARILVGTVFKVVGVPFDVTRRVLALPGLPSDRGPARFACQDEQEAVVRMQTVLNEL